MTTATETTRGFTLYCPKCGEAEARIAMSLVDMNDFTCRECDEEFTMAEAVETLEESLRKWKAVGAWIAKAPEF